MKGFSIKTADWWTCDSIAGPRYVPHQVDASDSIFLLDHLWSYHRLQIVNNEGYHDRDDFVDLSDDTTSLKVMFIGDSFTWGSSADVDSSFVEVFEQEVNKKMPCMAWNAGIPGTGTNYALFVTKKYLPLQKSDYVILGFYGNDFLENRFPFDRLFFTDKINCINLYEYDDSLKPVKISKRDAYIRATGSLPFEELNFFQKIMTRSRIIPFADLWYGKIARKFAYRPIKNNSLPHEINITKNYLKQLRDYTFNHEAHLIILLIPDKNDLAAKSDDYSNAVNIFKELSIDYVEPISLLSSTNYAESPNDPHWNNSGHVKVGKFLSQHLFNLITIKKDPQAKP